MDISRARQLHSFPYLLFLVPIMLHIVGNIIQDFVFVGFIYFLSPNRSLRQINCRNIEPFVLKSGDLINDHPNDNVPNAKLKSLYNLAKALCILNYVTTKYLTCHMNSVFVESWDDFKVSSSNIIRDSFLKKNLLPLSPPRLNNKYPGMCCLCPSIFWIQG